MHKHTGDRTSQPIVEDYNENVECMQAVKYIGEQDEHVKDGKMQKRMVSTVKGEAVSNK